MSYKKNIISGLITKIFKILTGITTSILVVRSLGAEGKGYIVYLLLIIGLIANYGHFGIINATVYFYKRIKYKEQDVFNVNLTYLLIISIIISIIIVLFRFNNIILNEYNWMMIVGGLILIFSTFIITSMNIIYIGNERIVEVNKYIIIFNFIYFFVIIILYLINRLNISTYFTLTVIISVMKSLLLIYKSGLKFKPKIDITLLKAEFKYGINIYLGSLFMYLNFRADQFLIKKMLGNTQLGIYSVAVTLAELVLLIPGSISTALYGRLYNISKNSNEINHTTSITIKYTFYICLAVSIIGIFMTPLIPIVYGRDFSAATQVTIILFIGIVFISIRSVSLPYFFSEGKPQIYLFLTLPVLILNITLNIILIPIMGINGAALASTVSYILCGLIYVYYLIIKEKFNIKELLIFNGVDFKYFKNIIRNVLIKDSNLKRNKN